MLKKVAALVLLGLSCPSAVMAQTLELIEGAYELRLGNVSFPGSVVGSITFRACASCDSTTLRVDTATTYTTSLGEQPLQEFLTRVAELRTQPGDSGNIPLTVFYSLDSGRITRIRMHDPASGTN